MALTAAGSLPGSGRSAIAVDPAQNVLGGGELGLLLGRRCRRRRRRPGAQAPGSRPLWNALHFPRALCPADQRAQEKNRAWPFCGAAASFAAGTFRGAGGYGKTMNEQDLQENQHGPIDPSRRSGRRRGTVGGHSRHDGAAGLADAATLCAAPGGHRASAGARTRLRRDVHSRRRLTGTSRRAVRESTAGPTATATVYGYCRAPAATETLPRRSPLGRRPLRAQVVLTAVNCLSRRP